jgi:IS30 family transposase
MLTMARVHTKGHPYRVSTETIYRCIYAQPVGERRKELIGQSETGAQQTRPAQQRPGSARPYP